MSTPQALVEALLMKSMLGEELIDTKFHLFSRRSVHSNKIIRLQALSANDVVLTSRSEFFAQLLSKTESSDDSFVDFDCGLAFQDDVALDDYEYGSDSDLEDEEEGQLGQTQASDDTLGLHGVSDDNDLLVVMDTRSKIVDDHIQTASTRGTMSTTSAPSQSTPQSVDCRNILVRDIAFRTWKALMLYLYTDKITFSSLKSQRQTMVDMKAHNFSTLWPCSPKSMYRLACKVRLDGVRDKAFSAIRNSLNEENILKELTSSYTSKYPEVLQMQVDVLFQHIASIPVIQNIPALVKRIANSQLPHGADIITSLYQKVLLQYHPQALALANAPPEIRQPPRSNDGCPNCHNMRPSSPPPILIAELPGQSLDSKMDIDSISVKGNLEERVGMPNKKPALKRR